MAYAWLQAAGKRPAHHGIHAIGADHQVESGELFECSDRAPVLDAHAGALAQALEGGQQFEAGNRGKSVAVHQHCLVAVHDLLLGPAHHVCLEQLEDLRLAAAQELERAVGEDHAEAKGGATQVLLENDDLVSRPPALEQKTQEKAGRAGADDYSSHRRIATSTVALLVGVRSRRSVHFPLYYAQRRDSRAPAQSAVRCMAVVTPLRAPR